VAANVTVMLTGLHSNPGFAMATGIGMGMGMEVGWKWDGSGNGSGIGAPPSRCYLFRCHAKAQHKIAASTLRLRFLLLPAGAACLATCKCVC